MKITVFIRLGGFIALLLLGTNGWSQTLSAGDISKIQSELKTVQSVPVTKDEVVVIETDYGKIVIELFAKETPGHAANFKKLVNFGYYTGATFHRVIPGFVVQGGDIFSRDNNPNNDGTGGPGYDQPAELGQLHLRGYVAAARLPDQVNPKKRSSGSQFYICLEDLPQLDQAGYTVFGKVILRKDPFGKGMDVVNKIAKVERDKRDRPLKNIVMKSVYMTTKENLKRPK